MEKIVINKESVNEKRNILLKYNGTTENDNINVKRIESLVDGLIDRWNPDIYENISILRAIFSDYNEDLLEVFYKDDNVYEYVKYHDSKLSTYKRIQEEYEFEFKSPSDVKFFYNAKTRRNGYGDIKEHINKELANVESRLYELENAKPIELNNDSKVISELYKIFYNENPDYTKEDISLKIQSMMSILESYGYNLGENYRFILYNSNKIPFSYGLQKCINRLYPFGEINVDKIEYVSKEGAKVAKIIGDTIRESISDEEDKNSSLKTISKVIYLRETYRYSDSAILESSKFKENSTDEITNCVQLVKKIHERIYE